MNLNNLTKKQQEQMSLHFENCFKVGELLRLKKWLTKDFDVGTIVVSKSIQTKEEFLRNSDSANFIFAEYASENGERIVTIYNPKEEKTLFITEFSVVCMEFDCFFEKVSSQ